MKQAEKITLILTAAGLLITTVFGIKQSFFAPDPVIVVMPNDAQSQSPNPSSEPDQPRARPAVRAAAQSAPASEQVVSASLAPKPREVEPPATVTTANSAAPIPAPAKLIAPLEPQAMPRAAVPRESAQTLELNERISAQLCRDDITFQFSVAKIGSRADNGVYLIAPQSSGRIDVGETISLSETCEIKLVRTGKKSQYFAVFDILETR